MGGAGGAVRRGASRAIRARVTRSLRAAVGRGDEIEEGSVYCIRAPYTARRRPRYYRDRDDGVVFQPDVYREAARLADELGAVRVVDLGCGNAAKLVELHPRFDVVGVDVGQNLERCRARFDFGTWLEHDLDADGRLPIPEPDLRRSVLVAADVVEHLRHPERLLRELARVVPHATAVLISTPDRDLVRGPGHRGPPPNLAHAREWNIYEFAAFLAASGMRHGTVGHTRVTDRRPDRLTILATLRPDGPPLSVEP
jgi:SAM-dependent methyltransferase